MSDSPPPNTRLHPITRRILASLDPRAMPLLVRLTAPDVVERLDVAVRDARDLIVLTLGIIFIGLIGRYFVGLFLLCVPPIGITGLTGLMLLAISPPIATSLAVVLVHSDAASDTLRLLRLTPIPATSIRRSYFIAALYRARHVLTWSLGVLPLVAAGMSFWTLVVGGLMDSLMMRALNQMPDEPLIQILISIALWTTLTLGLWGVNLAGIALGVSLGMRRSLPIQATVGTAVAIGLPQIVSIVMIVAIMLWPARGDVRFSEWTILLIALVCTWPVTFPYLTTLGLLEWSARHAEQIDTR